MLMTKLDRYVKRSMLGFPTLYARRINVLSQMYLVLGSGIKWRKNGTLTEEGRCRKTMDNSDIQQMVVHWQSNKEAMLQESSDKQTIAFLAQQQVEKDASIAALREVRRLRELNIDQIATTPEPEFVYVYIDDGYKDNETRRLARQLQVAGVYGGHYEEAKVVIDGLLGYCKITLGEMPYRVEQSFFNGAVEVVDAVIRSTADGEDKATLIDYRASLLVGHEVYDGGLVNG